LAIKLIFVDIRQNGGSDESRMLNSEHAP